MEREKENNPRTPRRTWQVIGLSALLIAALGFAFLLRSIFNPLLIAILIAYILHPVVGFLERRGLGRTSAILVLYTVILVVTVTVLRLVIPPIMAQSTHTLNMTLRGEPFEDRNVNFVYDSGEPFSDLNGNGRRDDSHIERARRWSEVKLHDWFGMEKKDINRLYDRLARTIEEKRLAWSLQGIPLLGDVVDTFLSGIQGLLLVLSYLILIPIYVFYILKGMDPLWGNIRRHLPDRYRERILASLAKIHRCIAAFFRGQLTICLIKGILAFVVFALLGIRMNLLFAAVYAVGSIVPFLGVIVAFSSTEMIVLADFGLSATPIIVAGAFILIEILEGFFLAPLIMGRETGLHPVAILLSLFIFGELFGVFGMMIAIPLAAVVRTIYGDYILPHIKELSHPNEGSSP